MFHESANEAEVRTEMAKVKAQIEKHRQAGGVAITYLDMVDTMERECIVGKVFEVFDDGLCGKEYSGSEFSIDFEDIISLYAEGR